MTITSTQQPIILTARKRDPLAYGAQKYDNTEPWNVRGGLAPNGVSATRYLRKTNPDPSSLAPLAQFLTHNLSGYVGGLLSSMCGYQVSVIDHRRTRGDALREQKRPSIENLIRAYDLDAQPAMITDWLFDIIEPNESDEDYWNRQAEKMLAVGATQVVVRQRKFGHLTTTNTYEVV